MSDSTTEVAQADLAGAPPPAEPAQRKIRRGRLILVDAIIAVATLLALVGIMAVWANRLLFSPDNWENASTQLLANPTIRAATSNYLVDQLYANVNVAGELQAALPPRL